MTAEPITGDGLINLLITSIAAHEGKFSDGRITGDRDYVLSLTTAVVQALIGHKKIKPDGSERGQSVKIPDDLFERISREIDRAVGGQSATV